MYAIGILPLVHQLQSNNTKQTWFADDATAGGRVHHLHHWWSKLCDVGPSFGYIPNPGKTWLIVKDDHLSRATELFVDTSVNITMEGKRHLGAALGPRPFLRRYVEAKSEQMVSLHSQPFRYCQNPTTCRIHSIYSWPVQQMDISLPHCS